MTLSVRFSAVAIAACLLATSALAIDVATYRKIDRRGLTAVEVLAIAGSPLARQRLDNCETWLYKGSDTALENRMVVVQLCNNKVVSANTELWFTPR